MQFQPDSLYYGDCLDVMRQWPAGCVDLCYLDPPFNSDAAYNVLFGRDQCAADDLRGGVDNLAQFIAFEDTWHWDDAAQDRIDAIERAVLHPAHGVIRGLRVMLGDCGMLAYLSYMAERLAEIRRLLKPSGSVYLHCDPTASHYLKAVLDAVFGAENFRNEINWKRSNPKSLGSVNFPNCRDVILRYSRTQNCTFQMVFGPHDPEYVRTAYRHRDAKGRYRLLPLLNPNDDRPNLTYEFLGVTRVWRWTRERMEAAYEAGIVVQTRPGAVPQYKKYLHESRGRTVTNDWQDIGQASGKESVGYPTQKPSGLLERILQASSNPGDVVLDPFCGCGTTIMAARKLKRRFIGIDISHFAIDLVRDRRLKDRSIRIHGVPVDMHTAELMARDEPFEFEKWAVTRVPGMVPNTRQVGDRGIDGRGMLLDGGLVLAQVKGGRFALGHFRDFLHVVGREDAACGIFTTLRPVRSTNAKREAVDTGHFQLGINRYPKAQFWSIADYFQNRLPTLPPLADPYSGEPMQGDILTS